MKLAKKPWNHPKATLAYLRYSDRRTAYVSRRRLKRALRKAHEATSFLACPRKHRVESYIIRREFQAEGEHYDSLYYGRL